ncbi:MAG TPA: hypothetical protein VFW62_05065 [bacterium]|nr:hypothetical protein [bacterium]
MLPIFLIGSVAALFLVGCNQKKPEKLENSAESPPPQPSQASKKPAILLDERAESLLKGFEPGRTSDCLTRQSQSRKSQWAAISRMVGTSHQEGSRKFTIYTDQSHDLSLIESLSTYLKEKYPDAEFGTGLGPLPKGASFGRPHQGALVYSVATPDCSKE